MKSAKVQNQKKTPPQIIVPKPATTKPLEKPQTLSIKDIKTDAKNTEVIDLESIDLPSQITDFTANRYISQLKVSLSEQLTVHFIPKLTGMAMEIAESQTGLLGAEKRQLAFFLVVKTAHEMEPDKKEEFQASLEMVPDMIELLVESSKPAVKPIQALFSTEQINYFVQELKGNFADGLQKHEIPDLIRQTMLIVCGVASITDQQRINLADLLIRTTIQQLLPDTYSDFAPILESIPHTIELMIQASKGELEINQEMIVEGAGRCLKCCLPLMLA